MSEFVESDPDLTERLFGENAPLARRYASLLAGPGLTLGLLGPREIGRLWERHVYNSLAPVGLLSPGADVVDIGSGAGLPGIPIALARPDVSMVLIEPLLRRSTFLTDVVRELDLGDRVSVRRDRAEDVDLTFDAVTARAVAPLRRLAGWAVPLARPHGVVLALKGSSALEEVASAERELAHLGVRASVEDVRVYPAADPTAVVSLRRVSVGA